MAVLMLVLASVGAGGCSNAKDDSGSREPGSSASPSSDDDPSTNAGSDDTTANPSPVPTSDTTHCRDALNTSVSACGAQFVDGEGQVITQNELLGACGQDKVECVVGCWDEHPDCAEFRDCLGTDCGLS